MAARLVELAAGGEDVILVARSEARAARLHRTARTLAPELVVERLPAWDCLPYDRAAPSRQVMGLRMAALARLSGAGRPPRLVIANVEAATQRLPSPAALETLSVRRGDAFDEAGLERDLERLGYILDDRVDEPGEAVLHGAVLDVFPPGQGTMPCRIEHAEGRITAIRRYDPLTQRSVDEVEEIVLGPASEVILPRDAEQARFPGIEHALPKFQPSLVTLFDLLPRAVVVLDPEAEEVRAQRVAEVADAYRARLALAATEEESRRPLPPEALYLDDAAWKRAVEERRVIALEAPPEEPEGTLPHLTDADDPEDAFLALLEARMEAGGRVALAGPPRQTRALLRALAGRLPAEPVPVAGWPALRASPPGTFALLDGSIEAGFDAPEALVIPPGEIRPNRARRRGRAAALPLGETALQPGDAVIHLDHGLGALRGVETVELGESKLDCLRLEYAGGTMQLVPLDEMDRLWRYGAEAEAVTLDRLGSESWPKRRAAVEAELATTAETLVRLAREREEKRAPVLRPPRAAYDRFVGRFPHPLTADQEEAIAAVLADLASGRPMDRLVCGDVGFGKTEVALRAAAVAALAGKQVAVLAPTTVLVRQHLQTFRRRFAGLGVRVEALSRLSSAAEAREIKAGIADGSVRVAIGTQALAAKGVRFKDLGLLIVDEEQRFGARQKAMLRELGRDVHVMALTATPIPRTLQSALVGLQELSVIATPPARRQPIRTTQIPLDDAVLRQALSREHRRNGQSFVVCSRIEDLPEMRERITRLLPELELIEAHGDLPADEVDSAMVRFAEGHADALLSTNIVETGLDVPRANTMLVWRADRFGLGQLHQLRGRVGRGRTRGAITLLTDPAEPPSPVTLKRLRTLEAFDRIGAGFAISARDMDLRGAGDLLGEQQAGHVKVIGLALYQHLLDRALHLAHGEAPAEEWAPSLSIGVSAFIPHDYVEEESLRVELHARLGELVRGGHARALADFAEEVADRFGPLPEPVSNLLTLARLRLRCRRLGIAELKVGPSAAAARFRGEPPAVQAPLERRGDRILLERPSPDPAALLATATALIARLSPRRPQPSKAPPPVEEARAKAAHAVENA
ncbi:DEAD/DEAH box helicase [Roseomonas sp. BN140053]